MLQHRLPLTGPEKVIFTDKFRVDKEGKVYIVDLQQAGYLPESLMNLAVNNDAATSDQEVLKVSPLFPFPVSVDRHTGAIRSQKYWAETRTDMDCRRLHDGSQAPSSELS